MGAPRTLQLQGMLQEFPFRINGKETHFAIFFILFYKRINWENHLTVVVVLGLIKLFVSFAYIIDTVAFFGLKVFYCDRRYEDPLVLLGLSKQTTGCVTCVSVYTLNIDFVADNGLYNEITSGDLCQRIAVDEKLLRNVYFCSDRLFI